MQAPNDTPVEQEVEWTLHEACQRGDLGIVKSLIRQQQVALADNNNINNNDNNEAPLFDVDQLDEQDWTPLYYAMKFGHVHVCHYLLKHHGADLDDENLECRHAMNDAIQAGHLKLVKALQQYFDFDYADPNGLHAIHFAALGGHADMLRYLVQAHGVETAVGDEDGWTPLHYAALAGDLDTVRYLVEDQQADVEATEVDGWVPLHCAANKGNTEIVQYLLQKARADPTKRVQNVQQTALHLASSEGRPETVKYLVEQDEHSFSVFDLSSEAETALHLACIYGKLPIVKYLVEREQSQQERLQLLFARNCRHHTAHQAAIHALCKVERVLSRAAQNDDSVVKDEDDVELQRDLPGVIDYLYSCIAPLAVVQQQSSSLQNDASSSLVVQEEDYCVKMNPDISNAEDRLVAQRALNIVNETDAHVVAYHVLGYLCLSDVKQLGTTRTTSTINV